MRAPLTGLVLGLLVLGACQSHQPPLPTPAEGSVVISDRLSNQRVNCFAEDRYGHIWMGTFRGLNKYTPGEFQHFFCMDDQSGLPDNQINALHSAQDGTLWVATINGVARHTQQEGFHRVGLLSDNRNISQILGMQKAGENDDMLENRYAEQINNAVCKLVWKQIEENPAGIPFYDGLTMEDLDYVLKPDDHFWLDETGNPVFYVDPGVIADISAGTITFSVSFEDIDDER